MKFLPHLASIQTYEAGKPIELVVREFGIRSDEVVKLASNENPLGPSPKAKQAIEAHAKSAHLYPDDSMHALKTSLAQRFSVDKANIIIGAGSDQIIEFISRSLLDSNSAVLTSGVTFAMYSIYAKQQGALVYTTPSYRHILDEFQEMLRKHRSEIKIVYLCTPNNPTGDALNKQEILAFIEAIPRDILVVVDGAYMEYAAFLDPNYHIKPADLIRYSNVIYLGTFSKAYGLGGMRVGYGIADKEIIKTLYKLRPPFNITTLSLSAAVAANDDVEFLHQTLTLHAQQYKRYEQFAQSLGIKTIKSYTNFITFLLDAPHNSTALCDRLLKKGVIIRDLASYGLNAVRITVGTPEQNDMFFHRFQEAIDAHSNA